MQPKVILITGASSGIGYDTAAALSRQGHKVYAAARRTELMEPLRPLGVIPLSMDVTDDLSMQKAVESILHNEQRIDVLINNAGYGYFGAIEQVSMSEARRQVEVNLFGLARLCQLVIPIMRRQGSGHIINTSSIAGKLTLPYGGWYHVSKYSVEALSDAMRLELKPFGINVTLIEPGGIRTNWGILAAQHLKESTAGSVYESTALPEADLMHAMYSGKWLSPPSVITRAMLRAVGSRRPRARYRTGRFAHTATALHAILPARWWDALMRTLCKVKV